MVNFLEEASLKHYKYEIPQNATLSQVITILNFKHDPSWVRVDTEEYEIVKSFGWKFIKESR